MIIGAILVISYFVPAFLFILIVVGAIANWILEIRDSNKSNNFKQTTFNDNALFKDDPLEAKGDAYERHIGKIFEDSGYLVIYNGLIRGVKDGGIDLIAISPHLKTVNLIQCKNWHSMKMELYHIQKIYNKLSNYNFDFLYLPTDIIKTHLQVQKDIAIIQEFIAFAIQNQDDITVRKTLYIASDKVIDLEVGKHLTMIQPDIFKYDNMKIVVEKMLR